MLNVVEFGDPEAPAVLALHGLTGHGRRWEALATGHLPDLHVIAPDLLGHGHSPWQPPWGIADHVEALAAVVDTHIPATARPAIVVGHSFGGALAIHLAHRRPDAFSGLVLLDPAQGLAPGFALTVATDSLAHWDYPDANAARAAKRAEGWARVPDDLLEAEIAAHLIPRPDGRVGWRVCAPMAATAWSEMSRTALLPPAGLPTHVVVADRVDPPFVSTGFLDACGAHRPDSVTIHHADCEHMVPFVAPDLCAALIRSLR
ncbi:MAG: alpha/beta fold hydrolase [Gordonia sp. (in: high G+C Gram-positive bacteria)]